MGMWSGIKHALNSTIGTANFKPLDKFIADKFLENLGVGASDTPLKILVSSPLRLYNHNASESVGSFVANTNGTIRIEASFFDNARYPSATAEFWVVNNNDIQIGKVTTDEFMDTPKKYSLDINVSKGVTYRVYIDSSTSGSDVYCNSLKICGSSIHSTLIS